MKAINEEQIRILKLLLKQDYLKDHYLAGGTSLALRYNHRKSVDLDLFVFSKFNQEKSNMLNIDLKKTFGNEFVNISVTKVGVFGFIDDVKTDFINYPYRLIYPLDHFEDIRLASPIDVAAMKIKAIVNRGAKKDFFDIFELLNHFKLIDIFGAFQKKYKIDNTSSVERALLYFEDAENLDMQDNSVLSLKNISWNRVKEKIKDECNEMRKMKRPRYK